MKIVTIILISVSVVGVIGSLVVLQQIVTWQAQVAFDQYDSVSKTKLIEVPSTSIVESTQSPETSKNQTMLVEPTKPNVEETSEHAMLNP